MPSLPVAGVLVISSGTPVLSRRLGCLTLEEYPPQLFATLSGFARSTGITETETGGCLAHAGSLEGPSASGVHHHRIQAASRFETDEFCPLNPLKQR